MNLIPISEIFDIKYGNQLDLNKLTLDENGVSFIGRSRNNLGLSAKVKELDITPFKAGLITVSMGGTYLLSSFVQPKRFYTGQNIKILSPKEKMSLIIKAFYCTVIEANRFRYSSHGREANSTFNNLLVPSISDARKIANKIKIPNEPLNKPLVQNCLQIQGNTFKRFMFRDIFIIRNGYYNKKPTIEVKGKIPFISAISKNNGVSGYFSHEDINKNNKDKRTSYHHINNKLFNGNCLTVSNDGSVGFVFYQEKKFTCSHSINILYLKDREWNPFSAMFVATIIEQEKYRWAYGRKWRPLRMPTSTINLPVNVKGNPDWEFMENYIKSLPYSSSL